MPARRSSAAIAGVQTGFGPSSNVSAIRRLGGCSIDARLEPWATRIGRAFAIGALPVCDPSVPAPIVWVAKPWNATTASSTSM